MAKQHMVIKVTMKDAKKRMKALKTVVGVPGVISAEVQDDTVTVVGDGVDSAALTMKLRKRMGFAELSRVAPFDEKKDKEEKAKNGMGKPPDNYPTYMYSPYPYAQPFHDPYNNGQSQRGA